MTPRRRRWTWVAGLGLLALILVGGRWAATETAERLWAATIPDGGVYLDARALARWFRAATLVLAVAWATANLLMVYRAIGSVQLPRRLGDLEIVEAVPRRVLLAGTLITGLVVGLVLTWGTGDWWLAAALAADPPRFGVVDPVLQRDLGYYVAVLPWTAELQDQLLGAVASAGTGIVLLYVGIGALTWRDGRIQAGHRTRLHVGVLLAAVAALFAWGALLDPAEVVGGLHGTADRAALAYRVPAAGAVAGLAMAVAVASLAWTWTGRSALLIGAWGTFAVVAPSLYLAVPAIARSARAGVRGPVARPATAAPTAPTTPATDGERRDLARHAFGWPGVFPEPPAFTSVVEATRRMPLWDPARVATALRHTSTLGANEAVAAVSLVPGDPPGWLVARAPDETGLRDAAPPPSWTAVHRGAWATAGPPLLALERDTGLAWRAVELRDTVMRFGPGFAQYAVVRSRAGASAHSGIPIWGSGWRRLALAWVLQSPELMRAETSADDELLWRRDIVDRLERLAPYARFGTPRPMVIERRLAWASWGYLASRSFPLVDAVPWRGRSVRYLRAGLIGLVDGGSGETRLYLAPGVDSLTAAWGRTFAPLVRAPDSVPRAILAGLGPPEEAFDAAAAAWPRWVAETGWRAVGRGPFEVVAPSTVGPDLVRWRAQAYEVGRSPVPAGILAAALTPVGPVLAFHRAAGGDAPPPPIVLGAQLTRPGALRVWPAADGVVGLQATFLEPERSAAAPVIDSVYLSWGRRRVVARTMEEAVAAFVSGADRTAPDAAGTPAQWARARQLLGQADSALRAGNLALFAELYGMLKRLFGLDRGPLAPAPRPD